MVKNYVQFLVENLDKAKAIYKNRVENYEKLKNWLETKNRLGYMGKMTEFLFGGVPYEELMNLYQTLEDLRTKNISINIDSYDKYEALLDAIDHKLDIFKFKSVVNQFPKVQKDIVMNKCTPPFETPHEKNISKTFIELYDIPNKDIFIKKISSYKSFHDLEMSLKRFLKSHGNVITREYLKSILDKDLVLVYENDDILIVQTKTHEAISKIGADTAWCIVRSVWQFNSYTADRRMQFVLFDFTKESFELLHKIGFTLDIDGQVVYAYDVRDNNVLEYTEQFLKSYNIKLKKLGQSAKVDISELMTMEYSDALDYIESKPFVDTEDELKNLLNIIAELSGSKFYYDRVTNIVVSLFVNLYKQKLVYESSLLTYKPFLRLKQKKFEKTEDVIDAENKRYQHLKNELLKVKLLVPNDTPENPFVYDLQKHHENYKKWTYKIKDTEVVKLINLLNDARFSQRAETKARLVKLKDIIKFYLEQMMKTRKLSSLKKILYLICINLDGEAIDRVEAKDLVDENAKSIGMKYKMYHLLDISYYYNEDEYHEMMSKYLLDNKIILGSYFFDTKKLNLLSKIHTEVHFDKADFLRKAVNLCAKNGPLRIKTNNDDPDFGSLLQEFIPFLVRSKTGISFMDKISFPFKRPVTIKYYTSGGISSNKTIYVVVND